jgi:hypothetical protein
MVNDENVQVPVTRIRTHFCPDPNFKIVRIRILQALYRYQLFPTRTFFVTKMVSKLYDPKVNIRHTPMDISMYF